MGPDDASAALAKALQCAIRPEPTPILVRLIEEELINANPDDGADSVSCFYLKRPLIITAATGGEKLTVRAVCAFDEDYPEKLASLPYKDLYSRGPGTSPGQLITAYVEAAPDVVWAWMEANDSRTQVERSSWDESSLSFRDPRPWYEIQCRR